jgi:hypothetical protein
MKKSKKEEAYASAILHLEKTPQEFFTQRRRGRRDNIAD